MSTSENTNTDVTPEETLDDFAANLFGGSTATPSDNAKSEVEEDEYEEEHDAPETEADAQPEETPEDTAEEGANNDEEEESEETPKKGNRFQERINELTAARREAERRADEVERKLNEVLQRLEKEDPKTNKQEPKAATAEATVTNESGPDPRDKNEDGSDKYPLGEFDPKFLRDTVQFMLDQKEAEQRKEQEKLSKLSEIEQQRASLQNSWNEKLVTAQERYPDFQEKGAEMLSVFEGIDESYGQYLTDTLMEMDAGPDVFYYLANNIEEAEKIVNAGPRKATIALAKLEAQFVSAKETPAAKIKTTKAPNPPPQLKGSAVARASGPVDVDNLDAFSKALFQKK